MRALPLALLGTTLMAAMLAYSPKPASADESYYRSSQQRQETVRNSDRRESSYNANRYREERRETEIREARLREEQREARLREERREAEIREARYREERREAEIRNARRDNQSPFLGIVLSLPIFR